MLTGIKAPEPGRRINFAMALELPGGAEFLNSGLRDGHRAGPKAGKLAQHSVTPARGGRADGMDATTVDSYLNKRRRGRRLDWPSCGGLLERVAFRGRWLQGEWQ